MARLKAPIDARRVVENLEPIDLTNYRFFGTTVILEIPTEAHGSEKIIYSKLNHSTTWFPVLKVGYGVDKEFVEEGCTVLINPDLPPGQIPHIEIEGRLFIRLEWHEIMAVRNKGYVPKDYKKQEVPEGGLEEDVVDKPKGEVAPLIVAP